MYIHIYILYVYISMQKLIKYISVRALHYYEFSRSWYFFFILEKYNRQVRKLEKKKKITVHTWSYLIIVGIAIQKIFRRILEFVCFGVLIIYTSDQWRLNWKIQIIPHAGFFFYIIIGYTFFFPLHCLILYYR